MQYRAPQAVAECCAKISGTTPVLDLDAGTGLLTVALVQQGIELVDGTDISPQMLVETEKKNVYQRLFEGDLTQRLEVDEGGYAGVVSSGTFTHGHVGPDALEEVLRCMASGAWAVLSVNAKRGAVEKMFNRMHGKARPRADLDVAMMPRMHMVVEEWRMQQTMHPVKMKR